MGIPLFGYAGPTSSATNWHSPASLRTLTDPVAVIFVMLVDRS